MDPVDVIVVGSGAIGLGIAWKTAATGERVVVIDGDPSQAASRVAAGMLAPVTEVHYGEEALLELTLASNRMYADWIAELESQTDAATGYRATGTLMVARDADDNAALDDFFTFQQKLGLEVQRLRGSECREVEPGLTSSVRGGILVPGDHQIEPRALLAALVTVCTQNKVEFVTGEVTRITIEGDRCTGVITGDGSRFAAGAVVIAAGAGSGSIEGIPEGMLPVRPVKGQLLELAAGAGHPSIARNIRGLDVYLVPRPDGRVIIGATMEEQGWDQAPTAGAVHDLLRYGYEIVPGITEMRFVGVSVGFRPGTPDNAPLIGATAIEGLIAATGHFRNGILLSPITADSVARLITEGTTPEVIVPFSPTRFQSKAGVAS